MSFGFTIPNPCRLSGIADCEFQNIPKMKARIGDVFTFEKFQFEGIFMDSYGKLYKSTVNDECIFLYDQRIFRQFFTAV